MVTYFGTGLYLDWALETLLQCSQSTLIRVWVLWWSASELEPCWSKVSSIRYHLSQTLFVSSPRWCQLICEKSNVPYCQRKSTLSSDAAAQPRFVPLTAEVINRSRQNPPSFHQDRNTPSCLAPSGLTNGLKFSLNGLPGDAAAELQRGASSSLFVPLTVRQPHRGTLQEYRDLCAQIMHFLHSRIFCSHTTSFGNFDMTQITREGVCLSVTHFP